MYKKIPCQTRDYIKEELVTNLCAAGDATVLHAAGGTGDIFHTGTFDHFQVVLVHQGLDHFTALFLDGELYGLGCSLGAQVIHTGLQTSLPGIEVHGG